MLLAAANCFLGVVGIVQVGRILAFRSSQGGDKTVGDEVKDRVEAGVESAKAVVKSS